MTLLPIKISVNIERLDTEPEKIRCKGGVRLRRNSSVIITL